MTEIKIKDIFSKSESTKKNKNLKFREKIIIDYREKNSLVPAELVKLGFELDFKTLKVADYIVKDVAIERKTIFDFLSSMLNKRLVNQLEEISQYKKRLLIIEGYDENEIYDDSAQGINANAVRGFLISILLKYKVPIIFTKNALDTAKFISVISKKSDKTLSLNAKKKSFNKKEQMQYIIESFPGIGPKNSQKLLEKFGSVRNVMNASEEDLKQLIGKKAENITKILEEDY